MANKPVVDIPKAAVLGYPVSHSRSPLIHQYWLQYYGLNGHYTRIAVEPENFTSKVHALHQEGFVGFNVTLPHKPAAFDMVDIATDMALKTRAVNTLWWDDAGRLNGDNTDVEGFKANLDQSCPEWRGKGQKAVILGSGGAASAIALALAESRFESIAIVNRNQAKASALADQYTDLTPCHVYTWSDLDQALNQADFLVNTTSMGMVGGGAPLEIDLRALPNHATVSDIVYTPLITDLLATAKAHGLKTVDGLGMLLHQAVPGFAHWFGAWPEVTDALHAHVLASFQGD